MSNFREIPASARSIKNLCKCGWLSCQRGAKSERASERTKSITLKHPGLERPDCQDYVLTIINNVDGSFVTWASIKVSCPPPPLTPAACFWQKAGVALPRRRILSACHFFWGQAVAPWHGHKRRTHGWGLPGGACGFSRKNALARLRFLWCAPGNRAALRANYAPAG